MAVKALANLKWKDITSENSRTYDFGNGREVQIENPVQLHVSDSGGHRILDEKGTSHYIPSGWIHLYWTGSPEFVL